MIRDDAEQAAGALPGYSVVRPRGMSADGRFLVIESGRTLVADDSNGAYDVFVRDRQTGALQRVSVATDGAEGNSHSTSPSISADGRHVVFQSLASNLDPTDTNGVDDLYIRDLDSGVTSLVTVGPSGERLTCNCAPLPVARLSGDGRFVLFSADFHGGGGSLLWLRDRDADQNGVFDEPGSVTTTGIDASSIDGDHLAWIDAVAISNDARYAAFSASAVDENYASLGVRMYLYDRALGTSVRVDRPLPGMGDGIARSLAPDFSDNAQLAYTSTAPHLVADDADAFADVFVYNIATATHARLQLTHRSAAFTDAYGTALSADGRFVAFTGYENDGAGIERWNVFAIDRDLHASFDIAVGTDGSLDDTASGASMSADGSAIAFNGGTHILQEGSPIGGVFVATTVSITSSEAEVPMEGGSVPVEVVVPAGTFWKAMLVTGTSSDYITYSTYSGIGPGTLDVEIPFNYWGESTTYQLWLGSEVLSFEQRVRPIVGWLSPDWGATTGGTPFQISGSSFQAGAIVTFDGIPATDIVTGEDGTTLYGVSPPHYATSVRVVVTNADGAASLDEVWFYYYDETPPVITATVTGSLGSNGWYTSDVAVQWSVVETDSELVGEPCASGTLTADVTSRVFDCSASSGGGGSTEQVVLRRDATRPSIGIAQPQALSYMQGQVVAIDFSCSDVTSGVATCTASQAGHLDTSMLGTFSFVVTAVDHAGNTTQSSVSYSVHGKVDTSLSLSSSPNPSKPNQDVTLTATVSGRAPDGGAPTGLVELRVNGVPVGSAPLVNGVASGTVEFKKGTYSLTATYVGDASFKSSSGTVLHHTK
ncbi:Ig-like domain repeat protein [Luteitalea pratensis]|uniref:Ig-like domain repeat protein n=1 Tax=Luteitalea pratensis TaxID=1855912 RepID=UPI0013906C36|nr:Ig-like domain repeat protein [Luteitalea pratensis]